MSTSYSEVVLPPQKGTGIRKNSERPAAHVDQVSKPKELRVPASPAPPERQSSETARTIQSGSRPSLQEDPVLNQIQVRRLDLPTVIMEGADGAAPRKSRRSASASHRDFIIAYDGCFIGHYASKRITNRKAFQNVALELQSRFPDFDPARLEIYKAVHLPVEQRDLPPDAGNGEFSWFAD